MCNFEPEFYADKMEHIPQLLALYDESFLHREPMTNSFGLTIEESEDYFSFLFAKAIEKGYLIEAVDTEKELVVGFCMAAFDIDDDMALPPVNDEIMKAVSDTSVLFDRAEALLEERMGVPIAAFFHPMYIGVYASYCHRGIALRLVEEDNGKGYAWVKQRLTSYILGWIAYFRMAE